MLSQASKLTSTVSTKIGDNTVIKTGHLYLDSDTPLELVKAMLFDFTKWLGQYEDAIKAQQAAIQESETPAASGECAAAAPTTEPECQQGDSCGA